MQVRVGAVYQWAGLQVPEPDFERARSERELFGNGVLSQIAQRDQCMGKSLGRAFREPRSLGEIRQFHGCAAFPEGGQYLQPPRQGRNEQARSEEHTSELQSLMRISYAVFCLKKKKKKKPHDTHITHKHKRHSTERTDTQ